MTIPKRNSRLGWALNTTWLLLFVVHLSCSSAAAAAIAWVSVFKEKNFGEYLGFWTETLTANKNFT